MQLSLLSVTSPNGGAITSMSGYLGEMWAVTNNSHVYRRTDAGFAELPSFVGNWKAVYVAPDGAVFLANSGNTLYSCMSNCTTLSAFTAFTIPVTAATNNVLCGTSSSNVYSVSDRDMSIGILLHWNGTQWSLVSNNLGLVFPQSCYIRPDGVLFIGGTRDVVRWEQGAAFTETTGTEFPDSNTQVWYGMHGTGDAVFTVGQKRRSMKRDPVTSTWSVQTNPTLTSTTWQAVGLTWPDEAFAAGQSGVPRILHISDGGAFGPAAIDLPAISNVNTILVVSPNELYFGGNDNNGPVIVRGKR